MRICAKMRCDANATATVALRYGEREVLITELTAVPDRNLLDLCEEHVRTLGAPVGWRILDDRNVVVLPDASPVVSPASAAEGPPIDLAPAGGLDPEVSGGSRTEVAETA